jgi:hypothetical protein
VPQGPQRSLTDKADMNCVLVSCIIMSVTGERSRTRGSLTSAFPISLHGVIGRGIEVICLCFHYCACAGVGGPARVDSTNIGHEH